MFYPLTNPRAFARSCRGALARTLFASLALLVVAFATPGRALAATPPTIDGDLTDMQQFANDLLNTKTGVGIIANDSPNDVTVIDPKIVPCPTIVGNYFQNGFDQIQYVVAQASNSTDLFLGIRVAGVIGDTDGDGNPDVAGSGAANCNPLDNVLDAPGIGPGDTYQFLFDTQCVNGTFNPGSSITITNDGITGTGTFAGVTGTIAYRGASGHDLEIVVHNAKLPPAFRVKTFVGSNTDGLSEDVGPQVNIQPNPIVKITKVASPVRVCVGKTTRFTLTLQNQGDSDLNSTIVEDDLPAGLTYAGNVSSTCNVGAPVVNGSAIVWPAFDLPFGASCTISFDVQAAPECIGLVTNHAKVDAATTGSCVTVPASHDETTFDVTCVDNPCVTVTASGPQHACPNTPVTISGNVTNCSKNDETVVVTVNGAQAFNATVAAGATMPYSFQGNMGQCTAGGNVPFAVHAVASSECGQDVKDAPVVQVRCDDKPCVTLTCGASVASACPGDPITISGNVTNCSLDPETIVVTVGGVQAFNQVVAGKATVPYSFPTTMPACQAGADVPFPVVATASNACGPDDVKPCTATVKCKTPPCVALLKVHADQAAACPNASIVVSGVVQNCGTDLATYTVTINGQQVFTGDLAPGATQQFQGTFSMGDCTAGGNVDFNVHATVHNTCGDGIPADAKASVKCKDKPCVQLTGAPNPTSACPGDAITISGNVKSCSLDNENVVVTVNGVQVFNGPLTPGQTQPYQFSGTMPQCQAGADVPFTVVATASGDCPPVDQHTLPLTIKCKNPPCVDLLNVTPSVTSICPNSNFTVNGTVKNCGTDAATYTVTVNGVQVFTGPLDPGATAPFSANENSGACTNGGQLTYTVAASAHNTCGDANKSVDVHVLCQAPSVKVTKTAESTVPDGGDIHYSITVQNNGLVDLENLVITDTMCPYSTYNNNASPTVFTAPAIGANGTVVWHLPALAAGASQTFTFQAKASLAAGGTSCATSSQTTCTNKVDVIGYCAGSGGNSSATSHAEAATTINCPSNNCPRTVGYWNAQCAQKGNGSTKVTLAQLTAIAEKVDDLSSFFNWSAGTDEMNFCRVITPPKPMTLLKQTERQFAGLLANVSISALGINPSKGGHVELDLNTPINCGGVTSKTVGDLIAEVDQELIALAGANQNDPTVKAKLGSLEGCLDAINNGQGIPVSQGCEEGGTSPSSDESGVEAGSATNPNAVELYRAVPNPFSASTSFAYEVSEGSGANVDITVYNVAGRQIRKLQSGVQAAGRYNVTWDGRNDAGVAVSRGVYFVRTIISGQTAPTMRLLFVRDN